MSFQQITFTTLLLVFQFVFCQQIAINEESVNVTIQGLGPVYADLNETVNLALSSCLVRDLLNDSSRFRVLSSEFRDQEDSDDCRASKSADGTYRAAVYDYDNRRTLLLDGVSFDPSTVSLTESNLQPFSNADELDEAARIADAGSFSNVTVTFGMPPFITRDFPDGSSERLLNIAITSRNSSKAVYVNMNNRTTEPWQAPSSSQNILACEAPPPAPGASSPGRVPGTANLVITQGGRELWTFQAIRPGASSGTKGSGIELRHVKYKGKTVLYRAHVPILNVEYEQQSSGCGPYYRDWQHDEWPLRCSGNNDLARGFRLCDSPATTILESHADGGNFAGVAVYVEGLEVVLKSQLTAGWYRYVSEWRFHVDGTLRPRFGFGAVYQYPYCVCQVHHHHVYWRLDFDIETAGNNLVREYNDPPIIGTSRYHDKRYEIRRRKDQSHHRRWEISNTRTGRTYSLDPGQNDGTVDTYGVGDLWVLKYSPIELDDGVSITYGSAADTRANIDKFVNGELVADKDVVIWYGAHFKHDQTHDHGGSHIVGPDIRPVSW